MIETSLISVFFHTNDRPISISQKGVLSLATQTKGTVKNKKIIVVILVAVLCCVIATFGLYKILTPQRTTIYIFNDNYSAGTLVTENMLTAVEIDQTLVVNSNQLSANDYFVTAANYRAVLTSAGVLRNDVYSGNALMSSMLTTTGGNAIEMTMKSNAVAVTIGANYVTAITSELSSGSRVNVYVTYEDSGTTLLLQNIRILSVGREGGVINSVTLEVDISQSLQLIYAYTTGSVHLGLVDATGYQYSEHNLPTYNTGGFTYGS